MALSFKESLALTQIASGASEPLAAAGYGAATYDEVAAYDNMTSSGIEYNKNYPIYDVYEDPSVAAIDAAKNVSVGSNQFNLTQERNAQFIPFSLPQYCDGYNLANGVIWIITDTGENKAPRAIKPINVYTDAAKERIYFGWLIDETITKKAGTVNFEIHVHGQVQGVEEDTTVYKGYVWKSKPV